MTPFQYILIGIIAYLIGSFSTGIVLSGTRGTDIRKEGSKSAGATNVTRVLGLGYGVLTLLGDFAKATLAVYIGRFIAGESGAMAAGIYAIVGHNWPVYYQFRGGKGIACSIAVLFWLCPIETLIGIACAIVSIAVTKFVSVGSLVLLSVSTIAILINRPLFPLGIWALLITALAYYQHRTNLRRLIQGKENRLSFKKEGKGA